MGQIIFTSNKANEVHTLVTACENINTTLTLTHTSGDISDKKIPPVLYQDWLQKNSKL